MEKAGIIRKQTGENISPWASPIVIVPKKTDVPGQFVPRLCIDYRRLNAITVKDPEPLPNIDHVLATLGNGPRYFTSLDLFSGYHQIGMTARAIERSAFITPRGTYVYLRMPFGLCNAPGTFQRTMNEIFADIINRWMMVYVDDVIIFTKTFQEHLDTIREVFNKLKKRGLFIKPSKCSFAQFSAKFLGHIVDAQGNHPDPDKVKAVKEYPRPTNITEV